MPDVRPWKALIPLAFAVVGCQWSEPGNRPLTRRSDAPIAPSTTRISIRPGVIPIAPSNTSIEFTGSTPLKSLTGNFAEFDGRLEMPNEDPKDATIRVVVKTDSTTTKIGLLTRHLKGEDFFDVARYPEAMFVSDKIDPTSEPGHYQVTGTLAFRGVRKPLTFPARIVVTPGEVTFEATLVIRQTEFGMIEAARKTTDDVPVRVSIHHRRILA